MKKLITLAAVAALCAFSAVADSKTVVVTAAGADTYSDPINVSGYIDRVEVVRTVDTSSDIVNIDLGTWSGTTLLQSIVDINSAATNMTAVVARPRVVGTAVDGTALTAANTSVETGTGTNAVASTILSAPYERIMAGGNLKLKVSASGGTNATVTATIYYERTAK